MSTAAPSAPEVPLTAADYSSPTLECDIVMKGGITSGVVYPLAVCEIARDYRFRSIGGTSAGAIAAAATAAAEYGRRNGGRDRDDGADGNAGFRELARLPRWLGDQAEEADRSNLFALFQPQPATDALFDVATASMRGRSIPGRLIERFPGAALVGALPGVVVIWLGLQARPAAAAIVLCAIGLVLAVLGALALAGWMLARQMRAEVPGNGFGLCSGNGADVNDPLGQAPALTPWLADLVNRLAGRPREQGPLTFGDLWGERDAEGDRAVDLRFMTTNLTHGRPYELPFASREFFYDPQELRALFPPWVMDWMDARAREFREEQRAKARARKLRAQERAERAAARGIAVEAAPVEDEEADDAEMLEAEGAEEEPDAPTEWRRLLPLPKPEHLPVVVGARMSLSFPLLISAVPLYTVDFTRRRADGQHFPERCWFSDGGICSNFPVHFFDAPLPSRPTFAINLRPYHPDHGPRVDEAENSWTPQTNQGGQKEWWTRFGMEPEWASLIGFGGAIINSMQNWVDNTQLRVPGYRDRVVHVSLDESAEGGMNLNMPPELIQRLGVRGQLAGRKLARRFSPAGDGTPLTWDNHRWVRLRSSMQLLEDLLREIREEYREEDPGGRTYEDLVRRGPDDPPDSYRWPTQPAARLADKALRELQALGFLQLDAPLFARKAPNPRPELRIMPRL